MWIFDKLFNRKIEGKSSLDDLAENVVVNKETNTTEIVGNLDVGGNITKNGQPIGGGKVYLHNIFISTDRDACLQLYSTSNEPFTIETLATFMTNNGITSRSKGIALSFESYVERTSSAKTLYTNFVIYALNNTLKLSIEQFNFDISEAGINIGKSVGDYLSVNGITDTVIEM